MLFHDSSNCFTKNLCLGSRAGVISLSRLVAKPGCWEIGFRQISLRNVYSIPMRPINNIAYQIQYLTICFSLDFQETNYEQDKKHTTCRLASPTDMQWAWGLKYRCFPGGPKSKHIVNIISNILYCLQALLMI